MRTKLIRRTLVAAAAAATVLGAIGVPAGATVSDVTSGQITFGPTGSGTSYTMPVPASPDPCSPALNPGDIDLVATGTAASGTWTATTPTPISSIINIPLAGATRIDFTFVTASGTYSNIGAPTGYDYALASTSPDIVIEAKMYDIDGSSCGTDDLECTLRARVLLTSGSGFDGSLPSPASGDTMHLEATSDVAGGNPLVAVGQCSLPYAAVAGLDVDAVLNTTFP